MCRFRVAALAVAALCWPGGASVSTAQPAPGRVRPAAFIAPPTPAPPPAPPTAPTAAAPAPMAPELLDAPSTTPRPAPAATATAEPPPAGPAATLPAPQPANPAATAADPKSTAADLDGGPLTLARLEELAQRFNPILVRDSARVESARGSALQASLYPNPRFDTNNPEIFAGRNTLLNVGFQQEIVVKGKLRLETASAEQDVRQAELTFQQDRLALLTGVRRQYFAVVVAQQRVRVLRELLQIVKSAFETGRKLEKAQETSKIDTLLLSVDYRQIEGRLAQAETLLAGQRKQLAAVVGLAGVETAEVQGDLAATPPDFNEEVVRRYAVSQSTLIQIGRAQITQNEIRLKRAEVEPYPNITVGPATQFGVVPGSDQFWLTVTFPIPAWDRNQGNIRAARANVRDAQESLRLTQNDQARQVADALGRYVAARQLAAKFQQEILPDSTTALRLARGGYEKGVFDFARYLQAQRTLVETNVNYIDALDALWAAATDVAGLLQLERLP